MKTPFFLILSLFGVAFSSFSQIENPDKKYKENFKWQVKQIDEFIERFNNADYTPIKEYLKDEYNINEVRREDLLRSLFNLENQAWNRNHVIKFLQDVTQSDDPPYLDLTDQDWYAELDCTGTYLGERKEFTLILSFKMNERTGGAKWVFNSVHADFLPAVDTAFLFATLEKQRNTFRTINPSSFGTDFLSLVEALKDTASFSNYLDYQQISKPLLSFFDQLYQKKLIFRQVNHVTYHFLQVPDWVFQVEDFPRQTTNSGWLISKLMPATEKDKQEYRKVTLYLN